MKIAVCSTSNEKAVQTIVDVLLPDASRLMPVFAGDIVPAKKPDPAIYKLAAEKLDVEPHRCFPPPVLRRARACTWACLQLQYSGVFR